MVLVQLNSANCNFFQLVNLIIPPSISHFIEKGENIINFLTDVFMHKKIYNCSNFVDFVPANCGQSVFQGNTGKEDRPSCLSENESKKRFHRNFKFAD